MKTLKQPKIWLIILALLHTGPGVIIPYVQMGGGTEHLATILLCAIVLNQSLNFFFAFFVSL